MREIDPIDEITMHEEFKALRRTIGRVPYTHPSRIDLINDLVDNFCTYWGITDADYDELCDKFDNCTLG